MCYTTHSPSFPSSNDKNLCSKAILSGVTALSKNDLEAEVGRSSCSLHPLLITPMVPHTSPQISSPPLSRSHTPARPHIQERTGLSVARVVKCEPWINLFFMQNRKLLGILHHSAGVNSTYHPCTCHPPLPVFLLSFPSIQVHLYKL